jgi:putative transcriptional regulator
MSTGKRKPSAEPPTKHEPDWAALEALTDEEIERQIAEDPDAAPDVSDWPLEKAVMMEPIDVKAIRAKLGMSQPKFARAFSLNLASLRDWEQQRRVPRGPALALLRIIDREPDAARRALATKEAPAVRVKEMPATAQNLEHRPDRPERRIEHGANVTKRRRTSTG